MSLKLTIIVCWFALSSAQLQNPTQNASINIELSERVGNFSIEMLYHTSLTLEDGQNFIMSPLTLWNALATISEGASSLTKYEIYNAIRQNFKDVNITRNAIKNIAQWLRVNTDTMDFVKINLLFVDKNALPLKDFQDLAKQEYDMDVLALDFKDVDLAKTLNKVISNATRGFIRKIVEPNYFQIGTMTLASALYFKGQWTIPFNPASTTKMPFFNSQGEKIGEVNMMNSRFPYPFAYIRELLATVIELPYGQENRLSLVIMLPNPGLSVESMFRNFEDLNLYTLFEALHIDKDVHSNNVIDCFIPRFRILSDLDLDYTLKARMGINQLYNRSKARLPFVARTPLYVSKIVHRVAFKVTEEGITAANATTEFDNPKRLMQFHVNRPFAFIIVEKVTNTIVFGGFYKTPSLY